MESIGAQPDRIPAGGEGVGDRAERDRRPAPVERHRCGQDVCCSAADVRSRPFPCRRTARCLQRDCGELAPRVASSRGWEFQFPFKGCAAPPRWWRGPACSNPHHDHAASARVMIGVALRPPGRNEHAVHQHRAPGWQQRAGVGERHWRWQRAQAPVWSCVQPTGLYLRHTAARVDSLDETRVVAFCSACGARERHRGQPRCQRHRFGDVVKWVGATNWI